MGQLPKSLYNTSDGLLLFKLSFKTTAHSHTYTFPNIPEIMIQDRKSNLSKWLPIATMAMIGYIAYQCRDTFEEGSLRGKAVVVTGASSGIGEQMAYHYARMGAKVLVTARTEQKLKKVIERCREVGQEKGEYYYHVADMSDLNGTQSLIEQAERLFGYIDFLVLNHIAVIPLTQWKGSDYDFKTMHAIFDVNFKSYVYLASHALPALERSNGSIVVMSSVAGRVPQPYVSAYSATKFALDGFFGGLREELKIKGSQVSITFCIIGFVGTDNAVSQLRSFGVHYLLELIPAADPAATALEVIKGSATRQQEVYYPYLEARLTTLMRHLAPDVLAAFNRYLFSKP